jgi:hypothetical protein
MLVQKLGEITMDIKRADPQYKGGKNGLKIISNGERW